MVNKYIDVEHAPVSFTCLQAIILQHSIFSEADSSPCEVESKNNCCSRALVK